MSDPTPERQGTVLALPFWLILVVVLLLFQPGQWDHQGNYSKVVLASWIAAISIVFVFECKVQAFGWAILSVAAFLSGSLPIANTPTEAAWLLDETLLLASLGFLIVAWRELGRERFDGQFWSLLLIAISALEASLWLEAEQTRRLREPLDGESTIALARLRQFTVAFLVIGSFVGIALGRNARNRIALLVVTLLGPGIGFGIAYLRASVQGPMMLEGADWLSLPGELFRQPYAIRDGSWAWMSPTLLLIGMGFGIVRLITRGRKMRADGEIPVTWLLAMFALGTLVVLIPASHPDFAPLPLVVLGVWLPFFALADMMIGIAEAMTRKPPPPGPSNIQRVK